VTIDREPTLKIAPSVVLARRETGDGATWRRYRGISFARRLEGWGAALWFGAFGLLPLDWASFTAYTATMAQSDILTVSPAAREIVGQLFTGGRPWLRPPRWYQALSVQMLPERLREGFGLSFDAHDRAAADRALAWIRRIYPMLPARLRHVGPYQEAQARLRGKPEPDWTTRRLNRAWIGRTRMERD